MSERRQWKWPAAAGLTAMLCALGGCASSDLVNGAALANRQAEASGSPFRWQPRQVNGATRLVLVLADLPSGPSRADALAKKEIMRLIGESEAAAGRAEPQVEDIKPLPNNREVWLLKVDREGLAYIVHLKPSAGGGTNLEITGPQPYAK